MRRLVPILVVALAACAGDPVAPTQARLVEAPEAFGVKWGEEDGGMHPYVGMMVALDAAGTPLWTCSGTLVSPTVYLTAGHCTEAPAASAEIWFDENVVAGIPGNGFPFSGQARGTTHTHPQYNPQAFALFDLGVVKLDAPRVMAQYGKIAPLNSLDALSPQRGLKKVEFTAVGYGLERVAGFFSAGGGRRLVARPHLIQINDGVVGDFALMLSNNASTGGTCFGDSGGPNFLGSSNVIAGVTSFAFNQNCAGTGGVYRVDRADDHAWLATFGITP